MLSRCVRDDRCRRETFDNADYEVDLASHAIASLSSFTQARRGRHSKHTSDVKQVKIGCLRRNLDCEFRKFCELRTRLLWVR